MSYHLDWNELFKAVVVGGLSLTPEVGSLVSKIAAALWPDTKPQEGYPLDQIFNYVNAMMNKIIDQTEVQNYRNEINGLNQNMKDYGTAGSQNEREDHMKFLLNQSSYLRSTFIDTDRPWLTLTYLVQFGTIRLGLLRERYLFYEQIYGQPDDDPSLSLVDLRKEIDFFKQQVATAREYAIAWRKSCVQIDKSQRNNGTSTIYEATVTDSFSNYSRTWQTATHLSGPNNPNEVEYGTADYDNHFQFCDTTYSAGLDNLTDPARYWDLFDPTNKTQPSAGLVWNYNQLGWGYNEGGNTYYDDKAFWQAHGPMTRMTIHHGDWVDGLEVWYGGQSSGLRGQRGQYQLTIDLKDGEAITQTGGYTDGFVNRFWVKSNLGQGPVGSGNDGHDNFGLNYGQPQPLTSGNTRLAYVAGRAAGNRVDEIRVCWLRYD